MAVYKAERGSIGTLFLIASMFVIAGCFGGKEDSKKDGAVSTSDNSQALLFIDGKPALTVNEYEEQKEMAKQANPQINMLLQMMPDAEFNILFKGMVTSRMMKEWVTRNKIDQQPEYIKQRKQLHDAMDLQLAMKYYDEAHPVHVSDQDAEKYYEEKKDSIPALKTSQGGVSIKSVTFDNKKDAADFLEKVKGASAKEFEKAAKEAKLKVSSMMVSQDSHVSAPLKNAVLDLKKFPHTTIVKVSDKAYWVVDAVKKDETQYRPYNDPQVKKGIKEMVQNERKEKELTSNIDKLKKEYNVTEDKSYFDKKTAERQKAVAEAQKVAAESQNKAPKAPKPAKAPKAPKKPVTTKV